MMQGGHAKQTSRGARSINIAARLTALERELEIRGGVRPQSRLFWHDELVACDREPDCWVEPATGEHHRKVICLDWVEGKGAS